MSVPTWLLAVVIIHPVEEEKMARIPIYHLFRVKLNRLADDKLLLVDVLLLVFLTSSLPTPCRVMSLITILCQI